MYLNSGYERASRLLAHDIDLVNMTSLGDSLTDEFIDGLVRGWAIGDRARFANAVAAPVRQGSIHRVNS